MEILQKLDQAIAGRSVITIERPEIAETDLLCIPIARSEDLLLAHVFYDFFPDGYRVIRIEDISDVIRDESEVFFQRILVAEGVYARLKLPGAIELGSWRTVLQSLRGKYDYCIIESEQEDDFLIGRVVDIGEWEFNFWYFDATGRWDDELDVVDYDELTSITFDDNYTNTIIKYIPPVS